VANHARVAGGDPLYDLGLAGASQARASIDKVMWAYQARQERTWVLVEPCLVIGLLKAFLNEPPVMPLKPQSSLALALHPG
jgi:hypothetical protein